MTSILTRSLGASVAAALSAVLIIATPVSATPGTTTVGDYVYSYDDANVAAGATITDYVGSNTVLVIPGTVTIGPNTYDVTTIGDNAFQSSALTSVTIPDSVTTIGTYAFAWNALTSVTIGGSVTTISGYAFYDNDLTSVTIPGSVTTIGESAFAWNALTSVTIGGSVTTIGEGAFGNNDLTSVTIPGSVTTIGDYAFAWNALTSVTIPDSVTTIGDYAFSINALTSVTIPDSVTTISDFAFAYNALTSVTIPGSVITISDAAFYDNALTSVTIPGSVTTIGDYAFDENPLVSVLMRGPVPSSIGPAPFGPAGASTPLVSFYSAYASSGYTTPTWTAGGEAYPSQALASFTDVPTSSPFYQEIEWMAGAGISTGYADGTFRPAASVTRQAMAAFMYRFAKSPEFTPPAVSPFTDVPTSSTFYAEITWMAEEGISTGYADGTFRPAASVTRQAMAAFMYRFAGSPEFTPPAVSPFTDVPTTSTFYPEITWMADADISTGYSDGTFRPAANVTRQAMAAFMYRLDAVLTTK